MAMGGQVGSSDDAIRFELATLCFGDRTVWADLDLVVRRGEFLAVLGPNGAGKTTLLRVLLGLLPLTSGTVLVGGRSPHGGNPQIGYIPQQRFERDLPARGRDIVALGVSGQRLGLPLNGRKTRRLVDEAIASVGATSFADAPVGELSGGEQQRLRVAQALLGEPSVLLCDEPLVSLDVAHQETVMKLIDAYRQSAQAAVVFVTHDINPVLALADRVLYIVEGRWAVGSADEVFTTERLSDLYGTCVEVLRLEDRLIVVTDTAGAICEHHSDASYIHQPKRG
jgi:zinc/manganese transport system ATP-binding protein